MAVPAINIKAGRMTSQKRKPCHTECSNWVASNRVNELGAARYHFVKKPVSPIMSVTMINPRKKSRERSRSPFGFAVILIIYLKNSEFKVLSLKFKELSSLLKFSPVAKG